MNLNCFELVKTVLDDLYKEISTELGEDTDSSIRSRLAYLSEKYEKLEECPDIDYSDPATRFAYIYRYTTAHANIVYQLIRDLEELRETFDVDTVKVSCIGGGPGSDLLGILKFMEHAEKSTRLILRMYDREEAWADSWEDVSLKLKNALRIDNFYRRLDVTETDGVTNYTKLLDTDLFTMIYFISELYGNREDARDFFEALFSKAKPGALIFFVDNSRWEFYNWFDQLAKESGLKLVTGKNFFPFQTEGDEEKTTLANYYIKFGFPKLVAKIAYRVYRRPSEEDNELSDW